MGREKSETKKKSMDFHVSENVTIDETSGQDGKLLVENYCFHN